METPTLKQLSGLLNKASEQVLPRNHIILRKIGAGLILFCFDTAVLALSMFLSVLLREIIFPSQVDNLGYYNLIPFILPLFPLAYYFRGLYPSFGIDVIEELRTLTYSTTVVFAILATMTLFVKEAWESSYFILFSAWLFALIAVPLGRAFVRKSFGTKSWWGIPVIILGAGRAGEQVIKSLRKHTHIGLRPIVAVDDDIDRWGYIHGIPVIGGLEVVPDLADKLKIDHAIIAMPNVPRTKQLEIILKYSKYFSHTTIIPELFGLSSLWVSTRDLGGILGLEVQQSLLRKSSLIKKRIFDIIVSLLLIAILIPIYTLIALAIRLDSKGKILFKQKRLGINASVFKIFKFRTMHRDAERRLHHILKENDKLRCEYDIYHKIKNDPRMTRVGRFLRKFSLDELPQFINVLKGEMSLIGPRAYLIWERDKFSEHDELILQVKPGISGLWQVTDHNQSSFDERKITDIYYIRNWSMFLDFYIFARTIGVVLGGNGE